mmetsp:Transcript_23583/g.60542  ORF Transcript_23583/g.60542 Transcript_23583/m.60542 type:complete len:336 (+) Transcript_23583:781-1788(+)
MHTCSSRRVSSLPRPLKPLRTLLPGFQMLAFEGDRQPTLLHTCSTSVALTTLALNFSMERFGIWHGLGTPPGSSTSPISALSASDRAMGLNASPLASSVSGSPPAAFASMFSTASSRSPATSSASFSSCSVMVLSPSTSMVSIRSFTSAGSSLIPRPSRPPYSSEGLSTPSPSKSNNWKASATRRPLPHIVFLMREASARWRRCFSSSMELNSRATGCSSSGRRGRRRHAEMSSKKLRRSSLELVCSARRSMARSRSLKSVSESRYRQLCSAMIPWYWMPGSKPAVLSSSAPRLPSARRPKAAAEPGSQGSGLPGVSAIWMTPRSASASASDSTT